MYGRGSGYNRKDRKASSFPILSVTWYQFHRKLSLIPGGMRIASFSSVTRFTVHRLNVLASGVASLNAIAMIPFRFTAVIS